MKYTLTTLDAFEFHDSMWRLVSHDAAARTLSVACTQVNLHKDALPDPLAWDMELGTTRITFTGLDASSFEPGREWEMREDGTWYTDQPQVIHTGDAARALLLDELANSVWVYDLAVTASEGAAWRCAVTAGGNTPYFTAIFTFDTVTVEWDDILHPAWYERDAEGHAP